MTEIIFVLKAISTLMDSLKKTQPENGEYETVEIHHSKKEREDMNDNGTLPVFQLLIPLKRVRA